MTPEEILLQYGFKYIGKCNTCNSTSVDKYQNGNYEVRMASKKLTFKLKKNGSSITSWLAIKDINEVLEKYIQKEVAVVPG